MKFTKPLLFLIAVLCSSLVFSQEYPYEESTETTQSEENQNSSLPVESPTDTNQILKKKSPSSKATSLYRMGVKAGLNFTSFHDRVCTAASQLGCSDYLDTSYSGIGFEGRVSFGWDLAYQPIFLEFEMGYQHKLMSLDSNLKVFQMQQGIFHRKRTGKDSLWKNGILVALDTRIAENSNEDLSFAVYPAVGISSLMEWGSYLIQWNLYLSQIRSSRNHWSTSLLTGLRF